MTRYPNRWSAETVNHIRTLAGEGLSGREIAAGLGVTRNVVIGICHRNKIQLGGVGTSRQKYQVNSRTQLLALKRKEARRRRSLPVSSPAPAPVTEGILVQDLTPNTCRWPVHTVLPGRYCGAHTDSGSYCDHHHARAYRGFE